MGYVATNISGVKLLIKGVDYSNELVTFNVSEDSIISSTIIQTTGEIVLAQYPGGKPVNDYFGTTFPVGSLVLLDIKQPNGEFIRHPRGFLYVLSSSYDAESKLMSLQVGCGLALALEYQESTLDIASNLINTFIPKDLLFKLPPDDRLAIGAENGIAFDFTLLANCLQAQGKVIYQDKWGYIQLVSIFGSTGSFVTDPSAVYKFTSFDTKTIISLESQANVAQVAQTKIEFTFTFTGRTKEPDAETPEKLNDENFEPYETNEDYYEANLCTSDNKSVVDEIKTTEGTGGSTTVTYANSYGSPGIAEVKDTDVSEYLAENPLIEFGSSPTFSERVTTTTTKRYGGPGRQVDYEISETNQKLLSAFSSIASDYAQAFMDLVLVPGGTIDRPPTRAEAVRQTLGVFSGFVNSEKTETYNTYGSGGELVKKVTDTYKLLGLFSSNSYQVAENILRFGPSFGYYTNLALATRTITTYQFTNSWGLPVDNGGFTEEVTLTTEYNYDPYVARTRKDTRRSANNNANPIQSDSLPSDAGSSGTLTTFVDPVTDEEFVNPLDPDADRLCAPEDQTTVESEYEAIEGVVDEIGLEAGLSTIFSRDKFIPSILQGGLNVPSFSVNQRIENYPLEYRPLISLAERPSFEADINEYARIVHRKAIADRLGFTIQEALRPEFYAWYPSMPYRLVIQAENKAFYMRISGSTWTLNSSEAVCSFESMMIGTYTLSSVSLPSENQLDYLLPPIDVPTTANNQIQNHDATIGTTVRRFVGSAPPAPSPTPTPSPSPAPTPAPTVSTVPVTSLPSITPTLIVPSVPLASAIIFRIRPLMRIRLVTKVPINTVVTPISITFSVPVSISFTTLFLNYGSINNPSGSSLDFGVIRAPSATNLELGTISNPTI